MADFEEDGDIYALVWASLIKKRVDTMDARFEDEEDKSLSLSSSVLDTGGRGIQDPEE